MSGVISSLTRMGPVPALAAALLPTAVSADDNVKIQKVQSRYMIICEKPELIGDLYEVLGSRDPKFRPNFVIDLPKNPACQLLRQGDAVFVYMPGGWKPFVDALVSGTLPPAYEGAPANSDIIRVRLGGESAWRYSLMRSLLPSRSKEKK